ncbi:hypothetical protein BH11ARM1_BH11ARM1_14640 [soil metagenome]
MAIVAVMVIGGGISIWLAMSMQEPEYVIEVDGFRVSSYKIGGVLPLPERSQSVPGLDVSHQVRDRFQTAIPMAKSFDLKHGQEFKRVIDKNATSTCMVTFPGDPTPLVAKIKALLTHPVVFTKPGLVRVNGENALGDQVQIEFSLSQTKPSPISDCFITLIEPN